jgi:hypothetical protein
LSLASLKAELESISSLSSFFHSASGELNRILKREQNLCQMGVTVDSNLIACSTEARFLKSIDEELLGRGTVKDVGDESISGVQP